MFEGPTSNDPLRELSLIEQALLGDVTPVPYLIATGTPDGLFDELQDSQDALVPIPVEQTAKGKKAKGAPLAQDIKPDDPLWELIGDRVIRRYKGTNRPPGVWPEVWA
eukprot:10653156-Heterocapsa_arctica.AAC.1